MYEIIYRAVFSHAFFCDKEIFLHSQKRGKQAGLFFSLSVLYSAQNKSNLKIVQGLELFRFNLVQR